MLIKTALGAASGSVGGGITAGLVKIVDNIIKKGKMDEGDLEFIKSPLLKHKMWVWLIENDYVTVDEITEKCDTLKDTFPEKIDADLKEF